MPRLAALLALAALASLPARARADADRPVLAVFTLEGKDTKLSAKALANLTEVLVARLGSTGRFQLIATSELRDRLAATKAESYRACVDQACQIEIGKELAAEKSLSCRIVRVGARCVVTANLFDLRRATTDRSATREGGCTEEAVMTALGGIVEDLTAAPRASAAPSDAPSPPSDDLHRADAWVNVDGGDFEARDGAMIGSTGIAVSRATFSDGTFEVDVEALGGPPTSYVSVGWRVGGPEDQKPTRAYTAGFQWDGSYHLFVAIGGQWVQRARGWTQNYPWKPTSLVRPKKNRIRVEAVGRSSKVFLNDQLLDELDDAAHTSGRVFIACGNGGLCKYTNLRITPRR